MTAWLDENCGTNGWAIDAVGDTRGAERRAVAYFAEATLASAFVARWCVGPKPETTGGVFQIREDEPTPRIWSAG